MMRFWLVCLAIMAAAPAVAAPAPSSPLVGSWALDTGKMAIPPEQRPKSVTIRFAEAGENRLSMTVDIVDPAGGTRHAEATYPLDGTPVAAEQGAGEGDVGAARMPEPGVLVLTLARNGEGASTRIYTVSADGQSQTEIATYYSPDGKPVLRPAYFTRIR